MQEHFVLTAIVRRTLDESKRMNLPHHQRPYVPCKSYDERLAFAVGAMEAIYQLNGPFDLKRELREKLFRSVAWILSECDGKYTTRYRSTLALQAPNGAVQHEHVFPITQLYFLSRHGLSLKDALSLCSACVVTKDEHTRLSACDRLPDKPLGWKRYVAAGIQVMDMLENRLLTPEEMESKTQLFEQAMHNARFVGDGEVDLELERREQDSQE